MIYTLTFNPALDYIMRLPVLREGETNRAASAEIQFGGKGINVSCVLASLGVESTVLGFVAGFTGEALTAHLSSSGIRTDFIPLPEGNTRINVKLKTPEGHFPETEINAPGPAVPEDCVKALMAKLNALTEGDTLVLAGSVPASLPRDTYSRILSSLAGRGVRFVVDAEGDLLTDTLPYRPFLVKPNRAELEGIMGRPLPTDADLRDAASHLQERGAQNVLVSLGGDGAILLDAAGDCHRMAAPAVKVVNTVGAGDSMVAGFLTGICEGYGYALRLGLAAGSATASSEGLATSGAIAELLAIL
ncbi:MAG: 1-phosphofructokinase [Clostridia bacterium]|nr:1-phosphofructokinase [Clostridia bacterium]